MEVVLVQNQEVTFSSTPTSYSYNGQHYNLRSATVALSPNLSDLPQTISELLEAFQIQPNQDVVSNDRVDSLCSGEDRVDSLPAVYAQVQMQRLLQAANKVHPTHSQTKRRTPVTYPQIKVAAGIGDTFQRDVSGEGLVYKGILKIQDEENHHFLKNLKSNFEGRLKLTVNLANIKLSLIDDYGTFEINMNEAEGLHEQLLGTYFIEQNEIHAKAETKAALVWSNPEYTYKASITIVATLTEDWNNNQLAAIDDKLCITKKLLNEQVACDVTIIPQIGVAINCHKSFLCAHSPVFETMFQGSMKESKTNTVEIMDMTEAGVRAFLAYLYYWDTTEAENDSLICFELFHAGHKYDIPKLQDSMTKIFLSKANKWYHVDVGMKLFQFARYLEDSNKLKMKSVQVLKSKFSELEQCNSYKELFEKDPQAAMELCKYFASL